MPFVDIGPGPDDVATVAKTEVTLTQLPPGHSSRTCFRCDDWFGWVDELGHLPAADRRVALGTKTDLASIPPFLWGIFATYGRQTMPAILHDVQCDAAKAAGDGPGGAPIEARLRREADDLFRRTLAEHAQFGVVTRWIMWSAVRLFGFLPLGLTVVLGVVVGLLHWSALVFRSVEAVLSQLTIWPWLWFLDWIPKGIARVLGWLSAGLAGDQPFGWVLSGLVALTLVLAGVRSAERSVPDGPAQWRARSFASLVVASAVAVLVAPPLLPLVLVTVVTRLLLWAVDLVLHVAWTHLVKLAPASRRPVPRAPRRPPPFPGGFPKP